ncbi:hypothetical protein [Spiroplasma endosymbiont of Poecilobothrus nobilitatus]|uniref:orotate phosphoribosyltransferase n=1 Tax=Spiroplasma endosymbiont of Poecilobothrus nobilitatus TaxID=1209220 RepID=UPI00313CBC42
MKNIITELIKIKAISINITELYTWASGIKAPIYIDNRLTMGYPNLRWAIAERFAELINTNFEQDKIDNIFGTATAGIPRAALLGHLLQLPFGYVRSSKKRSRKTKINWRSLWKGAKGCCHWRLNLYRWVSYWSCENFTSGRFGSCCGISNF